MSAYWEDEYDDGDYSVLTSPEDLLSNLKLVRDDFFEMLQRAPGEIEELRTALVMGQIDGCTYGGDCACIIGTVAKSRGVEYWELEEIYTGRGIRVLEEFAYAIHPGDTPDNNIYSRYFVQWIDEYLSIGQLPEESLIRE